MTRTVLYPSAVAHCPVCRATADVLPARGPVDAPPVRHCTEGHVLEGFWGHRDTLPRESADYEYAG